MPRSLKRFFRTLGEIFAALEILGLVVRLAMWIVTFVFSFLP